MARTVDHERHAARRLHIVDAALTCFATEGYEASTTAAICRRAGIGSGTFFHYFPTKAAVLVAILQLGTRETQDWFAAQQGRADALAVVRDWVAHCADELGDPRVAGFVRAVVAVLTEPDVAAALTADDAAQRDGLLPWLRQAQADGRTRQDLSPETLTTWVVLLLDGFVSRIAEQAGFTAEGERATLLDTLDRLLATSRPATP